MKIKSILVVLLIVLITPLFGVSQPALADGPAGHVLLGIYPEGWLDQTTINNELVSLDTWAGKKTTIAGIFSDIEDAVSSPTANFLPTRLNSLWNNGYVAFINLQSGYYSKPTAAQIASGNYDNAINKWAQMFAGWATGGKFAYIAPLPEMNVPWVSYSRDPANYKLAFARIQQIFAQNNVQPAMVRWVFSPNGWDQLPFDLYYPGNQRVDVVGFSAFNDGYCPTPLHPSWHTPADIYKFPIQHLREIAPGKPIFITRTGTSAYTSPGVENASAKNQWLTDAYRYLSGQVGVKAVIYYNYKLSTYDCDWAIYKKGTVQYAGYPSALSDPAYGSMTPAQLASTTITSDIKNIYFPLIKSSPPGNKIPVMLGSYSQNWPGTQDVYNDEYHALDAWAGEPLSLAGTFVGIDTDPLINIEMVLSTMWDNGYTPFVNLSTYTTLFTAKYIADGSADKYLRAIAHSFLMVLDGHSNRMAYIAPLEEMNGTHIPYGGDPANFKLAYRRFQQIFAQEGVPSASVRWVFAPNGNSPVGMPGFEAYYPGDSYVDVVGFTAYNFGYCPGTPSSWAGWHPVAETYGTYLAQMIALAPTKPLFITQTGTSAYNTPNVKDSNVKNAWLREAYNYLVSFPSVKAILYYNRWIADCDWSFYQKDGDKYIGYIQGVANPAYGYISPNIIQGINLLR